MDAASLYFGRRLMERVRAKQAEMSKPLLLGLAIDFGDYKARSGYLRGLADVIDWMEALHMEDEKGEMRP